MGGVEIGGEQEFGGGKQILLQLADQLAIPAGYLAQIASESFEDVIVHDADRQALPFAHSRGPLSDLSQLLSLAGAPTGAGSKGAAKCGEGIERGAGAVFRLGRREI